MSGVCLTGRMPLSFLDNLWWDSDFAGLRKLSNDKTDRRDYGLPLGLIIIDTLAACAGYRRSGEENDNAVGQALMTQGGRTGDQLLRAGGRSLR